MFDFIKGSENMKKTILICALTFFSNCYAQKALLIGLDKDGNEIVHQNSSELIKREFQKANVEKINSLNESLEQINTKSNFVLKKISLGLALEGEVGIGPWNLGTAIKHRLIFAKGK